MLLFAQCDKSVSGKNYQNDLGKMTQTNLATDYSRAIQRVPVPAAAEQEPRLAVDNLVAQYTAAQVASASQQEHRHIKHKSGEGWHAQQIVISCTCEEFVEMQTLTAEIATAQWQASPSILRTLNLADIPPHSDPNELNVTLQYLASELVAAGLPLPQRLVLDDRRLSEFPNVLHHEAFRELVEISFCSNQIKVLDYQLLPLLPQLRSLHMPHSELQSITPQFVTMSLQRRLKLRIAYNKLLPGLGNRLSRDGTADFMAMHEWFRLKQVDLLSLSTLLASTDCTNLHLVASCFYQLEPYLFASLFCSALWI